MERMHEAWVALGSNLGDRVAQLRGALRALGETPGVEVAAVSPVYETKPVGGPPQGRFLNAVVRLRTHLSPRALLEQQLAIEARAGRVRGGPRDGPRPLDLDLLLYADRVIDEPGLAVPHPRLCQRAFVLAPLAELAPELVHPICGESIEKLAAAVGRAGVRRTSLEIAPGSGEGDGWPSSP